MLYLYIIGLLALLILLFLAYLGCFKKIQVEVSEIGPLRLIYREQISSFQQLGKAYDEIEDKCKQYFSYKNSFGMYYDPPQLVKDQNQMRMALGIILDESDSGNNIQTFLSQYKTYRYIEAPNVKCIKAGPFPLRNNFSYLVGAKKSYPAMFKFQKEHIPDEEFYKNCATCLEIYSQNFINYYFVLDNSGQFNSKYYLTTAPQPEYKYSSQKKQN